MKTDKSKQTYLSIKIQSINKPASQQVSCPSLANCTDGNKDGKTMIEVTSFLLKHLYELMADHDQNDLDALMVIMAQNQIPNLICDTIVELLFIFVAMALIVVMIALSELYDDEMACRFFINFGCPQKSTLAAF